MIPFNCLSCNILVNVVDQTCPFEERCLGCYHALQQDKDPPHIEPVLQYPTDDFEYLLLKGRL